MIQVTPSYGEASLADLLNAAKKEIMLSLNCHALGTIQSFNSSLQTAVVTINYPKTYYKINPSTNQPGLVNENYAALIDCPVMLQKGGGAALTLPITITGGDPCVVLFNDRDMDNWVTSGQANQPVNSARLHAFTDALIYVGVSPFNDPIPNYDTNRAVLRNGTTGVGVSSSKVKIYNSDTTLNTVLQNILTQLETLANTVAVTGSPLNPAVATQLSTLASTLGGLIE